MKRFFQLLLVALVAISCTSQPRVKYVFYFIGDGMGINQVMGTEQYNKATGNGPETINFAHFPVRNFITTVSVVRKPVLAPKNAGKYGARAETVFN